MFCPNCGKEIKEGVQFCGNCGEAVKPNSDKISQVEPVQRHVSANFAAQQERLRKSISQIVGKINNKKTISIICIAAVAVVIVVTAIALFTSPTARMNRAISAGNIEKAYDIFYEKFDDEELPKGSVEKLKSYADSIVSQYESGAIDYNSASDIFDNIKRFCKYDSTLDDYISEAWSKIYSLNTVKQTLEQAEACLAEKDFDGAMAYYQQALLLDKDSPEVAAGVKKVQDALREAVISEADACIAEKDYDSARDVLKRGLQNLPDDSVLTEKLNGLDDAEVQNIVDDAYAAADSGDWDSAVETLEEARSEYSSNEKINNAYADITEKMPITLKNITVISVENTKVEKNVIKDRYGNIYDGGVLYNCSDNDAYDLCNLAGKYTTFKATAFVSVESALDRDISISIYADEKLVFFKDGITEESQPLEISIDVTGKKTLRIVVIDDGGYGTSELYLANSSFEKAEKQ